MKGTVFTNFFSNLFHTGRIIDGRLQSFCRFVLASLANDNPGGIFTPLITGLTTAYNTYFGAYTTKDIADSKKLGATLDLNTVTKAFADAVRAKHALIESVFPDTSSTYLEFFPSGLTEFSKLTRVNILTVVHRFATAATAYKAQLGGQPFADMFTTFETNITAALSKQNTDKSAVTAASSSVVANRVPVEDELMKIMFSVGVHFWPDEAKCKSYFDFSLLFAAIHPDSVTTNGIVDSKSVAVCVDVDITPQTTFVLRNKSDLPLSFYMTHVLGGQIVGHVIDVKAHQEHTAPFAEFGAPDGLFVYVKNDTDYDGAWEVRKDF